MNRFFWRIFFSFWLTLGLIILITIVTTVLVVRETMDEFDSVRPQGLVQRALAAIEQDGREGLALWIREERPRVAGLDVFFIDESGRDVAGRALPTPVRQRVRRFLDVSKRSFPENYHPALWAPILNGPDGKDYALMPAPRRPSILGYFGLPALPLGVLAAAILVSASLSLMLARFFSSPVRRLQKVVHRLAEGDLETRVGGALVNRRDEFGHLSRDFDVMAERLQDSTRARERLLRDISHELRTPLTRIRLAAGLAEKDPSKAPAKLERIERETERLDWLIGQILQLARLDARDFAPRFERMDLADLVDEIVADARIEAEEKNCTLGWEPGPAIETVLDPPLMRAAIENVLRNAVRHTSPGTEVAVAVDAPPGGDIRIVVRDRGPGVPEQDLEGIFQPFYRVSESRDRHSGGHGVGLAITYRVVRHHGGAVAARNAEGGGLELTITLPHERSSVS
jgi:two-component system sensor histidine kinase CpxA